MPLEVAPDEAVVGDLELERRGAGVLDHRGAMLLHQPEDAQDAADAELAVAAMDRVAEGADVGAGAGGLREQRQRGGRGARRPILGTDRVTPGRLAPVLPQERARRGMEEADVQAVPLDRQGLPDPAGRWGVVGILDLDAAVEMDRAEAELVVAERLHRQRPERRPLLGEHGRDLALGGAMDAGVGPAGVPAVEVGLRLGERLEAQALEGPLRVGDGRLDFPLAIRIPDATG